MGFYNKDLEFCHLGQCQDKTFYWIDGTKIQQENWMGTFDGNNGLPCGIAYSDGLGDAPCTDWDRHYVCQIDCETNQKGNLVFFSLSTILYLNFNALFSS